MADIFISYAQSDRAWVKEFAAALEGEGYSVWWDPELLPGEKFRDAISKELEAANAAIVVWSQNSIASDWVRDEAEDARQIRKLIPVLKEQVLPPHGFRQLQMADLSQWRGRKDNAEFRRVVNAVATFCAPTGTAAQTFAPPPIDNRRSGWPTRFFWPVAGALAVVLVLTAFTFWMLRPPAKAPSAAIATDTARSVPAGSYAAAPASIAPSAVNLPAGASFRDCTDGCPDMIVVPGGYFSMGSQQTVAAPNALGVLDNEGPQHEALISRRFALSRYPVTREEFSRFADETHRPDDPSCHTLLSTGLYVDTAGANWRHPGFSQTARDPVVCMSWNDARDYAAWLAKKTAKHYRLPTETEWEYAARAQSGDDTKLGAADTCKVFNGGDRDYHARFPGDRFADEACRDGYPTTSPVGSFPPNAFGLFDMRGNVWQWVEDCYHQTYDGAPADGSAWDSPNCANHPVRGGSWEDDARNIRFARRGSGVTTDRYSANGIRVARSM